jgi:hypothetical protein
MLSSSPHSTDLLPREDRLFNTRDLASSANRSLLPLDEKFSEKTRNPHQEAYIFRQFVPDSLVHAYYKNFLCNIHAATSMMLLGHSTRRCRVYPFRILSGVALLLPRRVL